MSEVKDPALNWRTAVDPATNRVYYYDINTRVTQWTKPLDLCSAKERDEIINKEKVSLSLLNERFC